MRPTPAPPVNMTRPGTFSFGSQQPLKRTTGVEGRMESTKARAAAVLRELPLAGSGSPSHVLEGWRNEMVVPWLILKEREPVICPAPSVVPGAMGWKV